jgi:hypothetical protein
MPQRRLSARSGKRQTLSLVMELQSAKARLLVLLTSRPEGRKLVVTKPGKRGVGQ